MALIVLGIILSPATVQASVSAGGADESDSAIAASIEARIDAGKALARDPAWLSPDQLGGEADRDFRRRVREIDWDDVQRKLQGIGESKKKTWLPKLRRYWKEFLGDANPSPAMAFNTMGDLRMETVKAYRKVTVHGGSMSEAHAGGIDRSWRV